MEKKKSISDILRRMSEIEQELHNLREDLLQSATPETPRGGNELESLQFTMDDIYEALGKKHKPYATRLKNALTQKGIFTLEDFLEMSPGQLLDLEGVGTATLQYTNKVMKKLGIKW